MGPAPHTMSRCDAQFLRGKGDEFSAGQRMGSGGDVPGLIPGGRPFGEAYEALRGIGRVGEGVRNGVIHEP